MKVRAHLFISGIVQGVFFRYATKTEATRLGVVGWVKNLSDGRVEVVAEGEKVDVERLVAWCHRGPVGARVTKVEVQWENYSGEYSSFSIAY
ncbi:MAG: acylphosphatase [bacterium]|nr:acylphosphatase [bacterium]